MALRNGLSNNRTCDSGNGCACKVATMTVDFTSPFDDSARAVDAIKMAVLANFTR